MSDIDRAPKGPDLYIHYCEHQGCDNWGSWGNSPSATVTTRWWCFEHFPHKSFEQEQALRRKLEDAEGGTTVQ
ncbi:hypothetical protein [Rhizobium lentis]|uniref:hypothetical protein n=1 Tax=Rhizobium lentis TaxID=1138194 RepID=UPI001C83B84B|nr:hypothetical protein [Rhizobium lentis]MBX4989367.1 hypothetical protein [Rhizobium lentis]